MTFRVRDLRRLCADPDWLFLALLMTIGGTYLLLIGAMLVADATYAFTTERRQPARIDFDSAADGTPLVAGRRLDELPRYGLKLSSHDAAQHPPLLLDSSRPPAGHLDFGTPNQNFGGPGVGAGGQGGTGANGRRFGNVVVVAREHRSDGPPGPVPVAGPSTLLLEWFEPVQVDELFLLDVDEPGGSVTAFNRHGGTIVRVPLRNLGDNSLQVVPLDAPGTQRIAIEFAGSGALAEVALTWRGRVPGEWERRHPWIARLIHNQIVAALRDEDIRASIRLSLLSCTMSAILSLFVAIPIGYVMSRQRFPGRNFIDAVLDIPIVLPPLVVGLSLLILFQFLPVWLREAVVYEKPAVVLAQFSVACAFAVRTLRATFDQIDPRREQVALTLGCSRFQAFGIVVLPQAWRGILTAGTLAWSRALGEFGPLLIFAGTTRRKTEVLSTTVFLELQVGDLGAAVAVSLIMVVAAVVVLVIARVWGTRTLTL